MAEPLLQAEGITVRHGEVTAVDGVSLHLRRGEVLAIVGESGCGKSSLARALLRLTPLAGGRLMLDGQDITGLPERALRPLRPRMQMVFQDPFASLNPRKTVGQAIGDPLRLVRGLTRRAAAARVAELLGQVGLRPAHADRLPHEFSGGQRQRVAIARALALEPELLVCDEPVSALDVSVRAQILNLLADISASRGLAMLLISHDLSVVEHSADRVAVMYLGRVAEEGPAARLLAAPRHPYTRALIAAVPRLRRGAPESEMLEGDPPSPRRLVNGCRFRTRCALRFGLCDSEDPPLRAEGDYSVACHAIDLSVSPIRKAGRHAEC